MGVFLEFGKRRIYGHVFLPKSGSAVSLLLFYRRTPINSGSRSGREPWTGLCRGNCFGSILAEPMLSMFQKSEPFASALME